MQLSRLVLPYSSGSRFRFIRSKPHLSSFTESTVFAATLPSGPFKESGKRQFSSLIDATFSSRTCKHLPTLTIAPGRSQDSYVWCFSWREKAENSSLIPLRNSAVFLRVVNILMQLVWVSQTCTTLLNSEQIPEG